MTGQTEESGVRHQILTPMLAYDNAAEAIAFYVWAFGAQEISRMNGSDGKISHAELAIASGSLMIADHYPGYNRTPGDLGGSTVILSLKVPDVDAFIEHAVECGASLVQPAQDQFYGERIGKIADPFGYTWILSTHIEDFTPPGM